VFGLVAMFRKKSTGVVELETLPAPAPVSSEGAGSSGSIQSLENAIEMQNQRIGEVYNTIDTQGSTFAQAFNQLANTFVGYQTNTNKVLEETSKSFETQLKETNKKVEGLTVTQPKTDSKPVLAPKTSPIKKRVVVPMSKEEKAMKDKYIAAHPEEAEEINLMWGYIKNQVKSGTLK
jgi:hypothetical protein